MKKDPQEQNIQLNNVTAPEEEQFTLEDIMREFGGWSKPEETAVFTPVETPVPESEPAEPPKPADSGIMRVAASEKSDKPTVKLVDLSGDTVRF